MKRTCKTCEHRDRFGRCWKSKVPNNSDCPDNKPACEHWMLAAEELNEAMKASLFKARRKHPVLLDVWPKAEDAEDYASYARIWKEAIANKDRGQLRDVLYSEVNEFLAEVARGYLDRAIDEAGDVLAVIYRVLNGEGEKKKAALGKKRGK